MPLVRITYFKDNIHYLSLTDHIQGNKKVWHQHQFLIFGGFRIVKIFFELEIAFR